jgi:hypothetical protein
MIKFLNWLRTLVNAATGVVTALAALIVAILALLQAIANSNNVSNVSSKVEQIHNTVGAIVDSHNASVPTAEGDSKYYVQLATYKSTNCDTAKSEIAGYKGAFTPPASLWSEPSGGYIVIAVQAKTLDEARSAVKKANELAKDPAQSGNDLAHALIRVNPNWQPSAC